MKAYLSHQRLKEVLHYEPSTGVFTWLTSPVHKLIGSRAGCPKDRGGYRVIWIDGYRYYEHHLAWFYMTGSWPVVLDHQDLDKANNAWLNLRAADKSKNSANRTLMVSNTSGFKGVSRDRTRWSAYITLNGKRRYIGGFATKEEAAKAYEANALKLFGQFARVI